MLMVSLTPLGLSVYFLPFPCFVLCPASLDGRWRLRYMRGGSGRWKKYGRWELQTVAVASKLAARASPWDIFKSLPLLAWPGLCAPWLVGVGRTQAAARRAA